MKVVSFEVIIVGVGIQNIQMQDIGAMKSGFESARFGPFYRPLDGSRRDVDADGIVALLSQPNRHVAGAAAKFQQPTGTRDMTLPKNL